MRPIKLVPGPNVATLVAWADLGDTADVVARNLALSYDTAYLRNSRVLRSRHIASMWALMLFSTTIILLVVRLIGL